MTAAQPLAGIGVLVTRPAAQADGLCAALAAAGAAPVVLPTIAIAPTPLDPPLERALHAAAGADWWMFVSRNAVTYGLARLRELGIERAPATRIAVVGQGTAAALAEHGLAADLVPDRGFNSEALLEKPEFAELAGQRLVIIRGVGGRELLADTARARGATVHYAEVYRRVRPALDVEAPLARWQARGAQALVVTSAEGLANLLAMTGPRWRPALQQALLVTVSERIAQAALAADFRRCRVSPGPGDQDIVQTLIDTLGK